MTTVAEPAIKISADGTAGVSPSVEDLRARVLDDQTVTALAEQSRGQGVALLGEGGT